MEAYMAIWAMQRSFIEALYNPYLNACEDMVTQALKNPSLFGGKTTFNMK